VVEDVVTLIAAVPILPFELVAEMAVEPAATPVTSPLLETVAVAGVVLAHVNETPVIVRPAESSAVAVS
jgi:hypothetical protein